MFTRNASFRLGSYIWDVSPGRQDGIWEATPQVVARRPYSCLLRHGWFDADGKRWIINWRSENLKWA